MALRDLNLYLTANQKNKICIIVNLLKGFTFRTKPRLCLMGNFFKHS